MCKYNKIINELEILKYDLEEIILNILVIGNGFDLAHGLPTRYSNFLDFITAFKYWYNSVYKKDITPLVVANRKEFENKLKKISENGFINFNELTDLEKYVEEFYKLVNDNSWIEYFDKRLKENAAYGKEYNWVDIEEEILKFIKLITEYQKINPVFDDITFYRSYYKNEHFCLNDIEKVLMTALYNRNIGADRQERNSELWKKFKIKLIEHLNNVIRAFEIYLTIFLRKNLHKLTQIEQIKLDRVISFNYTDTYRIYDDKVKCEFIHGYADAYRSKKQCNMVLGIDEFLSDSDKNIELDFVEYRKYFQRIIKRTDIEYKRELEKNILRKDKIVTYFFGHSMSVTDKEVLEYLLPINKNDVTKSIICYYSEDTFKSQIINLIKILGQDKLQELMSGNDPAIELINQNDLLNVYNRINSSII